MSRGFDVWQSQPLDKVIPPWLLNPRPLAMNPYANGSRHLSHCFMSENNKGGEQWGRGMVQRPNEETLYRKHMEMMQARLTALEPSHLPLADARVPGC